MDMKKVIALVFLGVLSLNSSAFAYDPLFKAIDRGNLEDLEELLKTLSLNEKNKDIKSVDEKNNNGLTPLIYAINNKLISIVKLLVKYDANVNLSSSSGNPPLMFSIAKNSEEIFKILLDKKADINQKIGGGTILISASKIKKIDPKWIYLILNNNADINARNWGGNTALIEAVRNNDIEKVKILKFAGADETIMNNNFETALDIADQKNNQLTNDLNNATDLSKIKRLQNELKINNEIIKILNMKFEKRESKKNK